MKKFIIVLVLIVTSVFLGDLLAQQQGDKISSEVAKLVSANNTAQLSSYFHDPVDLNINGKKGVFSKQQSIVMIKDFFAKYPVKSFKINHSGSSQKGMIYSIGTYKSKSENFRTYFLFKKEGKKYKIYQFHFEKE
ncbi:MAG: DUF4783 domain-containing protein [Bacteroidota bacterium]|nr:DUF4783 domain-containing protein [Bacteroidota bacterium]